MNLKKYTEEFINFKFIFYFFIVMLSCRGVWKKKREQNVEGKKRPKKKKKINKLFLYIILKFLFI